MNPDTQDIQITLDKIRDVIAETLAIPAAEILMDTDFRDDLKADSIDLVSLVMMLEVEFEININHELADQFRNLNDVNAYFKEHNIGNK